MEENNKKMIDKILALFSENDISLISLRTLFGGTGICYKGIMFGWIYANHFYLRGHAEYISMFNNLNMEPLILESGVIAKLLKYYRVTDNLWENEQKLAQIIQMVIDYSYQDKLSKRQIKESRIKELPNMTLSLERALFKVGIINLKYFQEVGAFESYFKLEQNNQEISKNILFCLHCALKKVHVATLSEESKFRLQQEYHEFLTNRARDIA